MFESIFQNKWLSTPVKVYVFRLPHGIRTKLLTKWPYEASYKTSYKPSDDEPYKAPDHVHALKVHRIKRILQQRTCHFAEWPTTECGPDSKQASLFSRFCIELIISANSSHELPSHM